MPWWDHLTRCRGTKADGTRCRHYCSVPYEVRPGELYLPMTCWQHRDQEEKLQRQARTEHGRKKVPISTMKVER